MKYFSVIISIQCSRGSFLLYVFDVWSTQTSTNAAKIKHSGFRTPIAQDISNKTLKP